MNEMKVDAKRRNFLAVAACAPAIAVASLLAKKTLANLPDSAASMEPIASVGYHETEHIRKYYYAAAYF